MSGRVAVLVSGTGTNLQALIDAQAAGELAPAEIAVVVSNRPGAPALDRARAAGIPAAVVDHRPFADRASFEDAVLAALREYRVDLVILAGFMRILTDRFLDAFPHRVVNTHPSLLPAFPGMHGARQALAHGVKLAGCTIHFVERGVDTGPIIAQAAVPVLDDDDEERLQRRIQAEEHRLLPEVTRRLAAGALLVRDRRVLSR